jgi:excisionase family DNA binding protein
MDLARACEPLIKPKDACEILGIGMSSLRNHVKRGNFPTYKLSQRCFRFRRSEIEDFLKNNNK